jgi:hypothetical protein
MLKGPMGKKFWGYQYPHHYAGRERRRHSRNIRRGLTLSTTAEGI